MEEEEKINEEYLNNNLKENKLNLYKKYINDEQCTTINTFLINNMNNIKIINLGCKKYLLIIK
jgi:hypothetical protein